MTTYKITHDLIHTYITGYEDPKYGSMADHVIIKNGIGIYYSDLEDAIEKSYILGEKCRGINWEPDLGFSCRIGYQTKTNKTPKIDRECIYGTIAWRKKKPIGGWKIVGYNNSPNKYWTPLNARKELEELEIANKINIDMINNWWWDYVM